MDTKNNLPAISRRSFLFGAATGGALTFLGSKATSSGLILAYADEAEQISFEVIVVGRDDIVVLTMDPSTGQVVPNMDVVITSYAEAATQKTLTLQTNETGVACVKARQLAENCDDDSPLYGYEFWAKVEASKDGYRDFATSLIRLHAGPGDITESGAREANLTIPTQVYDPSKEFGYVRQLSFDDYDIQYFDSSFCACAGNDAEHSLIMQLVSQKGKRVAMSFLYDGQELGKAEGTIGDGNRATLEIKGTWLKDITPEKETQILFSIEDEQYEAPCNLYFFPGADGLTDTISNENAKVAPGEPDSNPFLGTTNLSTYRVRLPEAMPVVGGSYFDIPLPELPICFIVEPTGLVQLGLSLNLLPLFPGLKDQVGVNDWRCVRKETMAQCKERHAKSEADARARYNDAKAIKDGQSKEGKQTKFGGVNITFDFNLVAQGTWNYDSRKWSAGLNANIIAAATWEWGQQTFLGPIPFYYGIDLGFMNTVSLYIGFETESGFNYITWNPDTCGLTWVPRFEFGVSAGVGVKGLASFGARGYAYLQSTLGFVYSETGKPIPHRRVDGGFILTLVVQAFWFSATVSVWHFTGNPILDNWEDSVSEPLQSVKIPTAFQNSKASYMLSDGKIVDLDGNVVDLDKELLAPINTDSLLKLAEFDAQVEGSVDDEQEPDLIGNFTYGKDKASDAPVSGFGIVPSGSLSTPNNYDAKLGVVPAVDDCIFKNVNSDSRHKIIKAQDGTWYMFRLCVVDVNSYNSASENCYFKFNADTGLFEQQEKPLSAEELSESFSIPRSRIMMSKLQSDGSWSNARVIDFSMNNISQKVHRMNCNDFDFAVCENPNSSGVFFFNIASSKISASAEDSFENRWRKQFLTFLEYDTNAQGAAAEKQKTTIEQLSSGITCYCPHINYHKISGQLFFSWVSATPKDTGAVYQLHTKVVSASNFSDEADTLTQTLYNGKTQSYYQSFYADKGPRWEDAGQATAITWVIPSIEQTNAYTIALHVYYVASKTLTIGNIFNYTDIAQPVILPSRGWFIVSAKQHVNSSDDDPKALDRKEMELYMPDENWVFGRYMVGIANMTSFSATEDGSRLFAVHVQEGEQPSTAASDMNPGSETTIMGAEESEAKEIKKYSIYAANWDSERNTYHTFYPLCQTSHPLDVVESAEIGGGLLSFITTEITDAQAGKGDIYQVNVPLVCSVQLISATCLDAFCAAGDTCHASVRVLNNGNLPLKAFTVKLYDNETGSGEPLATKCFENLGDLMFPTPEDSQGTDEDGNTIRMPDEVYLAQNNTDSKKLYGSLSATDFNSLLWPGDERTYGTIEFSVPDSWSGKTSVQVYAFISDAQADNACLNDSLEHNAPSFGLSDSSSDNTQNASALKMSEAKKANTLSAYNFNVTGAVTPDSLGVFHDADAFPSTFEVAAASNSSSGTNLHAATYTPANASAQKASSSQNKANTPRTSDDRGSLLGPLALVGAGAAAAAAYSKRRYDNEKAAEAKSQSQLDLETGFKSWI